MIKSLILISLLLVAGCNRTDEAVENKIFEYVRAGDNQETLRALNEGINPNQANSHGTSLVEVAITHLHFDTFNLLLEHGADPNFSANNKKMPLLLIAVGPSKMRFVEALVNNGANVDVVHEPYGTAFEVALRLKQFHIANFLISSGADPILSFSNTDELIELVCVKLPYSENDSRLEQRKLIEYLQSEVEFFDCELD